MNVRIIVLAEHAYVAISTPNRSLDVRLEPGRSTIQSLGETAAELRAKSAQLLARADLIEAAAKQLETPT